MAATDTSLFRLSGIRLRDVSFVLVFAGVFAILNILMVYLFAPQYGQDIYGSSTDYKYRDHPAEPYCSHKYPGHIGAQRVPFLWQLFF